MKKYFFGVMLFSVCLGFFFYVASVKAQIGHDLYNPYLFTDYDYSQDMYDYMRERLVVSIAIVCISTIFISILSFFVGKKKINFKNFIANILILGSFLLGLIFSYNNFDINYILSKGSLKSILIFSIISIISAYILKLLYKIKLVKVLLILIVSFAFLILLTILVKNFIEPAFFVPISNMMWYPI
jgi:hypothetical protein